MAGAEVEQSSSSSRAHRSLSSKRTFNKIPPWIMTLFANVDDSSSRARHVAQRLFLAGTSRSTREKPPPGMHRFSVHGKEVDYVETSLLIFKPSNGILFSFRRMCVWMIEWKWFERLALTAIVLNSISLAMVDHHPSHPEPWRVKLEEVSEIVFIVIFSVELVIKVVGKGLWMGRETYLSDRWSWLDLVVVVTAWLERILYALIPQSVNLTVIRTFRVMTLFTSLPKLWNVFLLACFVLALFSIVGLNLFSDVYWSRCRLIDRPVNGSWPPAVDIDPAPFERPLDRSMARAGEQPCGRLRLHWFPSHGCSLFYRVSRYHGGGMDSADVQVSGWTRDELACLPLFLTAHSPGGAVNLTVAVMWERYEDQLRQTKKEEGNEDEGSVKLGMKLIHHIAEVATTIKKHKYVLESSAKARLVDELPTSETPLSHIAKGKLWLQALCARIAFHPMFVLLILVSIFCNTVVLALDRYPEPAAGITQTLDAVNHSFTGLFTFEVLIKCIALGPVDFVRDSFNIFDVAVVLAAWIEFSMGGAGAAGALRAFRLLRVLKLGRNWTSLRILLEVISRALTLMSSFCLLLFLVIYIFALIGMQLFAYEVPEDEDDSITRLNFDTFLDAFLTVFTVLTGEGWNSIVFNFARNAGPASMLYFILLLVFGNLILLNLFLAILLGSFTSARAFINRLYLNRFVDLCHEMGVTREDVESIANAADDSTPKRAFSLAQKPTGLSVSARLSLFSNLVPDEGGSARQSMVTFSEGAVMKSGVTLKRRKTEDILRRSAARRRSQMLSSEQKDILQSVRLIKQMGNINFLIKRLKTGAKRAEMENKDVAAEHVEQVNDELAIDFLPRAGKIDDIHASTPSHPRSIEVPGVVHVPADKPERRQSTAVEPLEAPNEKGAASDKRSQIKAVGSVDTGPHEHQETADTAKGRMHRLKQRISDFASNVDAAFNDERRIVARSEFESSVLVLILLSAALAATNSPYVDPDSSYGKALVALDLIFTAIFTVEMVIKWTALGLFGQQSYFMSPWNCVDFVVVFFGWLEHGMPTSSPGQKGSLKVLRTLRAFRALRPLRIISRNTGIRVVVESLLSSAPSLANVFFVGLLFYLVFAILGVSLFKGAFYACDSSDSPNGPSTNATLSNESDCKDIGGEWKLISDSNFDNAFHALIALFQVSTLEGWTDVMFDAVDARGPGETQQRDHNKLNALFFVTFIVLGNFVTLNLFVGVVIDQFHQMKESIDGGLLISPANKWIEVQKYIYRTSRLTPSMGVDTHHSKRRSATSDTARRRVARALLAMKSLSTQAQSSRGPTRAAFASDVTSQPSPSKGVVSRTRFLAAREIFREWLRTRVTSAGFDRFISVSIFLNSAIMSTRYVGIAEEHSHALDVLSFGFTLLFAIECLAKIAAFGRIYFLDRWNTFDFTVVSGSIFGLTANALTGEDKGLSLIPLMRSARLLQRAQALRILFQTMLNVLPSLGNIAALLSLIFFIYAILGMHILGTVKLQTALSDQTNFRNIGNALLALLRLSTGEDWHEVMFDCTRGSDEIDCESDQTYEELQRDGPQACGSWVAYIYFLSFMLLVSYILMNLFIAAVVHGFSETVTNDHIERVRTQHQAFIQMWRQQTKAGDRLMPLEDFVSIIVAIPPPVGTQSDCQGTSSTQTRLALQSLADEKDPLPLRGVGHDRVHIRDVVINLVDRSAHWLSDHFWSASAGSEGEAFQLHQPALEAWKRRFPDIDDGLPSSQPAYTIAHLLAARKIQSLYRKYSQSRTRVVVDRQQEECEMESSEACVVVPERTCEGKGKAGELPPEEEHPMPSVLIDDACGETEAALSSSDGQ
ncbi:unnamed protein product [Vitrella brassicaformis CCMP3155]|uniref:Calcium-channel protein CCH1 n=2 Tax=Vitrella brassicaformis TaxID=1169539 RepID=A0A0G4FEG9_VITBC|nr:unnamed protein product [Vitrella brassicaformis CCMP3155]|eukprot:CEM11618.1 unnamed protein product [Vitrella brassicaformis CCMP3155]